MVQELLGENPPRVVKGVATGSREHKWLDVAGGPFARGEGVFSSGADHVVLPS